MMGSAGWAERFAELGIGNLWTLHEAGTGAALRRSRAQCGLFSGRAYPDRSVRALHAGHAGSGFVPTIRTPGVFRVLTPMRICGVPGTGGTGEVGWPGDVPAEAARTVIHLFQFRLRAARYGSWELSASAGRGARQSALALPFP